MTVDLPTLKTGAMDTYEFPRASLYKPVAKIFSGGIQFRIDVSCLAMCGFTVFKSSLKVALRTRSCRLK